MGIFMIGYGILKQFTGIGFSDGIEKYLFDIIIFGALGLFIYNRKMVSDEKKAKAAEEDAKQKAAEAAAEPEVKPEEETFSPQDENRPHWERHE